MKRLSLLTCLVFAIIVMPILVTAAPPKPPKPAKTPPPKANVQALIAKLNGLYTKVQQLRIAAVPKFVKATEHYYAALHNLQKLHPPGKLEGEIAHLRHEERLEIQRTLDPAKAKAIQESYLKQKAELEAVHAPKLAEIAKLTNQKNADLQAVQAKWNAEIAKINPPENRLETRLGKFIQEERQAMHALLDQTKAEHKDVIAKYDAQMAHLQQKLQPLEERTQQANKTRQEKIAAAESELQAQLNQLDPPDDRLADKLALARAQRDARVASATSAEEKKTIQSDAAAEIKELEEKTTALREDIKIARDVAKVKIKGFDEEYRDILAAYNPVEDPLDAQVQRLRAEEADEIRKLVDPAKLKAIRTSFGPRIAAVEKKISSQENDKAQLLAKMESEQSKITSA